MDDRIDEQIEKRLEILTPGGAPSALRTKVLADVRRELRSRRRDRRLAQAAAVLLAVGIGLNGLVEWQIGGSAQRVGIKRSPDAIVEIAVTLAETTDAETAHRLAQHLAALSGTALTEQQSATIEQRIHKRLPNTEMRKDG